MNKVILMGRMTRDPEVSYRPESQKTGGGFHPVENALADDDFPF